MNYYFLAASLPALSLDQPAPLTAQRFRALCDGQLAPGDAAGLAELDAPPDAPAHHPFVALWHAREAWLRNTIVRARAARLQSPAERWIRADSYADTFIQHGVHAALARPDPLEREMALDHLRWQVLDELAGFNPFAAAAILAYAIRLRLVERWTRLRAADGAAALQAALQRDWVGERTTPRRAAEQAA
jgi:Protein of unknown function (DUF2764)